MSYTQQVRFCDEHDDRGSNQNHRRGGGGRGNPRGQQNRRGYQNYRGRGGNSRGGYRQARGAIMSRNRGRGDWRSRQLGNISGGRRRIGLADDEDDVSMSDGNNTRYSNNGSRFYQARGSRGSRGSRGGKNSNFNSEQWFKIKIHFGKKMEQSFIYEKLNEMLDVAFVPVNYHINANDAYFYVNGRRLAEAITACSRRITNKGGFKVAFSSQYCPNPPKKKLNEEEDSGKLMLAMNDLYTPATTELNLTDFQNNKDLNKEGIYPMMSWTSTFKIINKIIKDNIPEMESLVLSKNSIHSLDILIGLVPDAPSLNKLDLSENRIQREDELDKIKDMKLTQLNLEKNPICDKYRDNESQYVAVVRRRFPKLIKLDGHDLPPQIGFAVETKVELPIAKGSFFLTDAAKEGVQNFLSAYFELFDSDERQKLIDAYHESAMMSLSVFQNKSFASRSPASLGEYMHDSRNLVTVKDSTKQHKLLLTGPLAIVAMLKQLPKTKHDYDTITIDVTLVTETMLSFTVTGVFAETSGRNPATRAFSRVFVTVPQGTGVVIMNEELTITNPSPELLSQSFKTQNAAPTPAPSPVTASPQISTESIQQEMIKEFSKNSHMNIVWSARCLAQYEWDYERAAKAFTKLREENKIPDDAFDHNNVS